ncbi:SAVMC3_10250 family protein [Streptomyces sp. NPDC046805]|uniref:SAVMC3_10250 family protein n=1 Tax=Streptomyces sp. NPDC046805 TaxID=3155134 RepID=UPI0033F52B73
MSEKKARSVLSGAADSRLPRLNGTVTLPFGASVEVAQSSPSDGSTGGLLTEQELSRAIRQLERHEDLLEISESGLRPNWWIRFDLQMIERTMHEDSGGLPDDVAMFAGRHPAPGGRYGRGTNLLLCGSVHHLRSATASAGRMGSDTGWLRDVLLQLHRREEEGVFVIPEFLEELCPTRHHGSALESAAHYVFGILDREYPSYMRGQLRGLASVLMDIDSQQWTSRLVVATPLYVETVPRRQPASYWWRRPKP